MTLRSDEIATLAALLRKLSRAQPWPSEIYEAYARVGVGIAIEVVCVRRDPNGWEVFLAKRPSRQQRPHEPYPNQWHSPGTILRKTDTFNSAFRRLETRELAPAIFRTTPRFIKNAISQDRRGRFLGVIHVAELTGTPRRGAFFPFRRLPKNLVPHHRSFVLPAARRALEHP
ncbi:hypothetical protein HY442_00655 [Candidatus Parcubacteria bacterium]|nr:hypothetical protein [Candidatus Parcubacteria bacterium]MBI4099022.1 hypothetical protein [Candidatus Parcubacteria bacterium]MBI4385705.1 hypothetical protein [Candidatus Parcubacteria bacterium]